MPPLSLDPNPVDRRFSVAIVAWPSCTCDEGVMRPIKPKYCTVHGLDLGDGAYTWRYSQQHECLQEVLGTPRWHARCCAWPWIGPNNQQNP